MKKIIVEVKDRSEDTRLRVYQAFCGLGYTFGESVNVRRAVKESAYLYGEESGDLTFGMCEGTAKHYCDKNGYLLISAEEFLMNTGNTEGANKTEWRFESAHPKDMDVVEIIASTTRQHPLALVRVEDHTPPEIEISQVPKLDKDGNPVLDKDGNPRTKTVRRVIKRPDVPYVAINQSLLTKARLCRIDGPSAIVFGETENGVMIQVSGEFAEWVEWARTVRAAKWPEGRRDATVTVKLPKV